MKSTTPTPMSPGGCTSGRRCVQLYPDTNTHPESNQFLHLPSVCVFGQVFYPKDSFNHPLVLQLIFKQVHEVKAWQKTSWRSDFLYLMEKVWLLTVVCIWQFKSHTVIKHGSTSPPPCSSVFFCLLLCRLWMTLCQKRAFASPRKKGRKWRLFSVVRLFSAEPSSSTCSNTNAAIWHSWVSVCVIDSSTRGWAEYGSSYRACQEDNCHCSEGYLGNILLPSIPCISKWSVSIEDCEFIFFFWFLSVVCVCLRVFVQGSVGTGVQVLSVSHSGIKLLKTVKSSAAAPDYFRVLRPYTYVWFLFWLRKFLLGFRLLWPLIWVFCCSGSL